MLIATTDSVAGREIAEVKGLVRGSTARARHIGRDIFAVARNIVGGEVSEYTKLIAESREQALDRMAEEAKKLGADAVVGVRFGSSVISQGVSEILAYGTAVTLK